MQPEHIYYYLVSIIFSVIVLWGISMMSKVKTAVKGNLIGSAIMVLAIGLTLWNFNIFSVADLWIAMLIGTALGLWMANKVKMIQMPQMVGLLNGFGGGASMIAGILSLSNHYHSLATEAVKGATLNSFGLLTAALAVFTGAFTLSGSIVAAGKLHGKISQKPKFFQDNPDRHALLFTITLIIALVSVVMIAFTQTGGMIALITVCTIVSLVFGVLFATPVGGADMPITISLLNSMSGVAGSIAGMAIDDFLLVAVGGIVGASGLFLTQIMSKAMNRPLKSILFPRGSKKKTDKEEKKSAPAQKSEPPKTKETEKTADSKDPAQWLKDAKTVIITPGYGMAVAQAQSLVKQLSDKLEGMGKKVEFAIHSVAGRMPGHMNILLAEVDVPYEKLHEMDDINPKFKETDVAIVIGANDVVNPAANTVENTPLSGVPILNVSEAKKVIICNFDKKPGYAGVDNPLYEEGKKNVALMLGDAKDSLKTLLEGLSSASKPAAESQKAANKDNPAEWLKEAKTVIITPGYGMAVAQAQSLVKQLSDKLESMGKKVEFAIHSVAGRMPGHMNILLAEVDVPYEKLHEMDDINPKFKETDVAIVIGANDVVNPAANTVADTPLSGVPILNVSEAKKVIICNFDKKPGYAGVDNPLYEEGKKNVALMLGDAKDSLKTLLEGLSSTPKPAAESKKAEADDNNPAEWLKDAKTVIITPGYGMAVAQAQSLVKQLSDKLEGMGKKVEFAIHSVAGRMPGHMNILLAEVDVPYEKLHEMDDINPKFKETDVAIVIGANDVVNPAANTVEETPLSGVPILNVSEAKKVIICNFDKKPGYAGVDNPLYEEGKKNVALMLGDAKDSLKSLLEGLSSTAKPATTDKKAASSTKDPAKWLKDAKSVIITPGYGMAVAQAQSLVKQLADKLEGMGKKVEFAIHSVAGRMPGHMNILLAEVDVPYEKLHEMDDINPEFKNTDVAIVIGANDVVNPAANTVEDTPLSGVPILNVSEAKKVIICNFDKKPGYAGVDNPLYEDGQENVALMLGDAKDSLKSLLEKL